MARKPRFVAVKQPHLVTQAALQGATLFVDSADFVNFLELLKDSAKLNEVAIHAYALLPTRLFFLATPARPDSLSHLMQWIGRRYVPYYNRKYGRLGSLWQSRFRAAAVDPGSHFLQACQYVEEAPLREGLVNSAGAYYWSSYASHAGQQPSGFLLHHPVYWSLGNTPFDREAAYQRRLEQTLPANEITLIENGLRGGWPIGAPDFALALQKEAGRRLQPGKRGRPARAGNQSTKKERESVPN